MHEMWDWILNGDNIVTKNGLSLISFKLNNEMCSLYHEKQELGTKVYIYIYIHTHSAQRK